MKTFFITDKGEISRHKVRESNIVGHGIVHPDQNVILYLSNGKTVSLSYPEIKVGSHYKKNSVTLNADETVTRIDIITLR